MTTGAPHSEAAEASTIRELDEALARLAAAVPFARPRYQPDVLRLAEELLDSASGIRVLYERAGQFEQTGVFHGGPWADPEALQTSMVGPCLRGDSSGATLEALSELRFLAIATGRAPGARTSAETARRFLRDVVALNLNLLFPHQTEEPVLPRGVLERARHVFALIAAELSLDGLRVEVTEEIVDLAAQRPIMTRRIKQLITLASNLPPAVPSELSPDALDLFLGCIHGPSPLSRQHADAASYREALRQAPADTMTKEAAAFGTSLRETGVVHGHHAVLLRRLSGPTTDLLPVALGLDETGRAELARHRDWVHQLIQAIIVPATADAVLGLAYALERAVFSLDEVPSGLRELIEFDMLPDVEQTLLAASPHSPGLTANAVLTAGALSVLGQPLGIGQGKNPTCQAARCISLWAAHAPAMLLRMVAEAARDGTVAAEFEGARFLSREPTDPPIPPTALGLDPAQLVLVPHLNRIYDAMLARASLRPVDAHKWVNPAMYGRWVPKGFACCIDPRTQRVTRYDDFLSTFFATHHPSINDDAAQPFPNPVGLLVTDARGRYLGPHAVAIQRVAADPRGEVRVYFFNPNDEGRQQWAPDIRPSVRGFDELPGESSLPFAQFASRIYAFHFDPYRQGDAYAVPGDALAEVRRLARESWAPAFTWQEPVP